MSPIQVLYEDNDIIAINKSAGLLSQGTPDPNRPHVVSVLKKQFMNSGQKEVDLYLHHRLDKDTSGVLLLGKSQRANAPLTEIFRQHQIQKTYLALSLRKNISINFDQQQEFKVENHLAPVRGTNKQLMRMVPVNKGGWRAETHFRCLEIFSNFYLMEAKPITGRTHQIRVHLAGEKLPIAGDNLYGGKSTAVPRLLLHAKTLSLNHPITGEALVIEASLPKDFNSVLEHLRSEKPKT